MEHLGNVRREGRSVRNRVQQEPRTVKFYDILKKEGINAENGREQRKKER